MNYNPVHSYSCLMSYLKITLKNIDILNKIKIIKLTWRPSISARVPSKKALGVGSARQNGPIPGEEQSVSVPAADVCDVPGHSPGHRAEGCLWTELSVGAVPPAVELRHGHSGAWKQNSGESSATRL